jgi:hypothetical protein
LAFLLVLPSNRNKFLGLQFLKLLKIHSTRGFGIQQKPINSVQSGYQPVYYDLAQIPVDVVILVGRVQFQLEPEEQITMHDRQTVVQCPTTETSQMDLVRLVLHQIRVQNAIKTISLFVIKKRLDTLNRIVKNLRTTICLFL